MLKWAVSLIAACICTAAVSQDLDPFNGTLVDWMRPKVVHLVAEGETAEGVPYTARATGFFINSSGNILTTYHLVDFDPPLSPGSLKITAHIASSSAPPVPVDILNADKLRDLLVLDVENFLAPEPACVTEGFQLGGRLKMTILSVGFPSALPFVANVGVFIGEGPNGSFAIDIPINPGQSGSPVFDQRGRVVAIAKGQLADESGVGIPGIYLAIPLPGEGDLGVRYDFKGSCPYDAVLAELTAAYDRPNNSVDPALVAQCASTLLSEARSEVPFEATGGARAEGPGATLEVVKSDVPVCYSVPPGYELDGVVAVSDLGNNGGRGSVGPVSYNDPNGDGRVDNICVVVSAWSERGPFTAGGWQNARLAGVLVKRLTQEDETAAAEQCRRTIEASYR
jgi:hypothetical protein